MIVNLWMGFNDRARPDANPQDEDNPGHSAYRALGDPSVRGIFRKDNPAGPRDYELWSLYYEVEDVQELRDIRNDLNADFPGQLRTIGAWDFQTGAQLQGFPLHARILEFVPDIVTYDIDGNETSRVRPTVATDVNLGAGQAPRDFS